MTKKGFVEVDGEMIAVEIDGGTPKSFTHPINGNKYYILDDTAEVIDKLTMKKTKRTYNNSNRQPKKKKR